MCKKSCFFYRSKFFEFFGSCFDSCLLIFEKRIALLTGSHGLSRGGLHSNAISRQENLSDRKFAFALTPPPSLWKKTVLKVHLEEETALNCFFLLWTCLAIVDLSRWRRAEKREVGDAVPASFNFSQNQTTENRSSSTIGIAEPVNGQTPLLQKVQVVTNLRCLVTILSCLVHL